jgi:hypothetical protein
MRLDFQQCARGGRALIFLVAAGCVLTTARASILDTIGVTVLRTVTTNVNGAGIRVAQVEAEATNPPPTFEVNPNADAVGQPVSLFTYITSSGTSSTYPNSLGAESGHADTVASYFYGIPGGVATNVVHVDNYDANYFVILEYTVIRGVTNYISLLPSTNISAPVVNQSFIMGALPVAAQQCSDTNYDTYAARYNTLFVSGAGNGGQVYAPSTCYNGISVAVYGAPSSIGPTLDNGRAKPDITAPENYTSFSTPQVAGAAAVLFQAGLRGDGGSATNAAADIRTVKALLLNGAIKPADWTNGPFSPLDARYGAGVLNIFNSYKQLAGGKQGYTDSVSVTTNAPHPPTGASGSVPTLSGWDFNTNSSTSTTDGVKHYYFDVTNDVSGATFTATATLVWNRQQNKTAINNLDLFLYDANSSNLIASCASPVDNVEQIFIENLPPGRYDLQVLKNGGATVSSSETYALAFEFFSMSLNIALADTNAVITWPVYPAGFVLESTTLGSPVNWNTNNPAPDVINGQNQVVTNASSGGQLFRLRRP